jgi:hypothetical protein
MNKTRVAWILAIVADLMQIVLLPFFGWGGFSPVVDGLDFAMAIAMITLLGWHLAFLPTVVAELVPGLNLIPSWTAAVFFVTRKRKVVADAAPKELPPTTR